MTTMAEQAFVDLVNDGEDTPLSKYQIEMLNVLHLMASSLSDIDWELGKLREEINSR